MLFSIRGRASRLLAGTAICTLPFLSGGAAASDFTWGGPGATTNTSDANLGTNWSNPPAGAPPVNPGQAAIFGAAGPIPGQGTSSTTVDVTAGPITPDSWTFTAQSANYAISGQAINFNGAGPNLINNGGSNSIANNMTGAGILVTGGTLALGGTNNFGSLAVTGGSFRNTGALTLTSGLSGNLENNGTLKVNNAAAVTHADVISGTGSLTKSGTGTLTLSGANTYSGATTVTAGRLEITNAAALGTTAGGTTVNSGATLALSDVSIAESLSLAGAGSNGAGALTTSGTSAVTGTTTLAGAGAAITAGTASTDSLTLAAISGSSAALTLNGAGSGTVSGVLSGSGAVTKSGTGSWTLSGTNTFTGALLVSSGTLVAASNAALGSYTGITTVQSGASLVLASGVNISSDFLSLNGPGVNGTGALAVYGGTATYAGAITLRTNATITAGSSATDALNLTSGGGFTISTYGLTLDGAGTGTITSQIYGTATAAINKTGTGTWILSGNSIYTGRLTISEGTVQIGNGGTTGLLNAFIIDNSVLVYNNSLSINSTRPISGTGDLVQAGSGTLTLSGTNTYTGATTVNAGTLALTGSITSAVTNNANFTTSGTVTGSVTNNGTATATGGTIAGSITNNAGSTFNINGAVTTNGDIGNAGGATLALSGAGRLTLNGALTNAGTVTMATGGTLTATAGITNNAAWTGNVTSNAAAIVNAAGATWTGDLTSTAGTVTNNGTIIGAMSILGGTLGGNGTLGSTTIDGGTLAPGNSIGTLTVNGNLVLTAASTYMVDVSPANADRVNVSGTATLGGATVNASFAPGSYVAKRYTIVNATGGVTGTFGTQVNTNLPANVTSNLSYDANNAYLDLTLNYTPPAAPTFGGGLSGNQQNVAHALVKAFNANGGIPMAFAALTPAGLTQAAGETTAGVQQPGLTAATQFVGTLSDPTVAGRGADAPAAMAFADDSEALNAYASGRRRSGSERDAYAMITRAVPRVDGFVPHWSLWASGFGGTQTTDGNAAAGTNTSTSRIGGIAAGADYWLSAQTVAGFALAGGATSYSVAGGGTGRSDLMQFGGFVRHAVGASYVTASAAYGWQSVSTDRMVAAEQLRAKFDTSTYTARLEGGHRFATSWLGGLALTPYAAAQLTYLDLPAYAESTTAGAGSFALAFVAHGIAAPRTELGLRSDRSFAISDALLTLRGRAAWAHDYNTDRSAAATFQSLPGASFVVGGARPAADAALTSTEAEWRFASGISVGATFEGEFSGVTRSYAGKGMVRYTW